MVGEMCGRLSVEYVKSALDRCKGMRHHRIELDVNNSKECRGYATPL